MNNEEKNTYVIEQITNATIALLEQHNLSEITISQITNASQVSRNSFYRNYKDKKDILYMHVKKLITEWKKNYEKEKKGSNAELYASLFTHLKENSNFYLLLKKRGLFELCLKVLLEESGPRPEYDNMTAYVTSFIAYGTFGWIEEWIGRGMQESAETMAALLSSNGMK